MAGKENGVYPQHFCDLLHCHCCHDRSGPVTYFSLSFSATQMISPQQMRNSCELSNFAGKRAKGGKKQGCFNPPPASASKMGGGQPPGDGWGEMLGYSGVSRG